MRGDRARKSSGERGQDAPAVTASASLRKQREKRGVSWHKVTPGIPASGKPFTS